MKLNPEQQVVVDSEAKKILCIAGPGSGKTRVMVERINRLTSQGEDPARILVLTYTNAAADEFKERLAPLNLGFAGTLHSLCLSLVRKYHSLVWMPERVGVVDEEQREEIMESIMAEMGLKCKAEDVLELLPCCRGKCVGSQSKKQLAARQYHRVMRANGLVDFDTMLGYGRDIAVVLGENGAWPFKWLFADEVQDSSAEDWACYLDFPCEYLFCVGDPYQAVYSFRGGDVTKMLDAMGMPGWTEYNLRTNYRSGPAICEAANRLLNGSRDTVPASDFPSAVNVLECGSPMQECHRVMGEAISHRIGRKLPIEEFAVLCRTNAQAKTIRDFLSSQGILVKRKSVSEEPRDWNRAKALLAAMSNPWSDLLVLGAYRFLTNDRAVKSVKQAASLKMVPVNTYLSSLFGNGSPYVASHPIHAAAIGLLTQESRTLVLGALKRSGGDWGLALLALDQDREPAPDEPGAYVGTVHGAKGKEFSTVAVCGVEEGWFPGKDIVSEQEDLRLLYVAVTRAKSKLVLTWCSSRPQNRGANMSPGPAEPRQKSRWLQRISQ